MNARSAQLSRARPSVSEHDQRPDEQGEYEREHDALQPDATREPAHVDRQAERDEDHELGETCQRAREALDLALVREARVPENKPGDEDGEEAGAVGERVDAYSAPGENERQHRVQPFARKPKPAEQREQDERAHGSPSATPIDISTANSRTTTQKEASAWVASSTIPSMSAIPAGSLTPASPSRVVPERPPTSRRPSTENMTAGSVGATAAPTIPARIQSKPSA